MNRAEMIDAAMYADAMSAAWAAKARQIRADLTEQAREEFEKDGVAPSWRTGTATVPLALSSDTYRVTNQQAWLEWVHRNRPEELEEIVQVRPSFEKAYFGGLNGIDGVAYNKDGEVHDFIQHVPGGEPKGISIRPKPGVREAFADIAAAAIENQPVTTEKGTDQ